MDEKDFRDNGYSFIYNGREYVSEAEALEIEEEAKE